ncbi:hypothetical protein [Arenibaculum sp.]|jgi:hypothetical protein|uniref:hypothetical protein n=1 Tax=Arenibaculum sp. TaxID=2865862 RepID=UPI002E13E4D1|nr:hypothetical protein [Arenibaculum sp.]
MSTLWRDTTDSGRRELFAAAVRQFRQYGTVSGTGSVSFANPTAPVFIETTGNVYSIHGALLTSPPRIATGPVSFTVGQGSDAGMASAPVPGSYVPPLPGRKPAPPVMTASAPPIPGRKPTVPVQTADTSVLYGAAPEGGVMLAGMGGGWLPWVLGAAVVGAFALSRR